MVEVDEMSVLVSVFVSLIHLELVTSFFFGKTLPHSKNTILLDFFVGESLKLKCELNHGAGNVKWNFYRYKDSILEVKNASVSSILEIESLSLLDSGRYDCVTNRIVQTWKANIHDPNKMTYVLSGRGQAPWEDTEVSEFKVALYWSDWTQCDGCNGNGERRKFGFCRVTWPNGSGHCSSRDVPALMRPLARSRPEEILVDVCYDQCQELQEPLAVHRQRVDLSNHDSVELTCRSNVSTRSAVRWERDRVALKRTDVSFGYQKSKGFHVAGDNRLLLNDVTMAEGGTIRISCVEGRQMRTTFDLVVAPLPAMDVPPLREHLAYMLLSSVAQVVAFLFFLTVYTSLRTFTRNVSEEI